MHLGIMFFSSSDQDGCGGKYDLLREVARFADRKGFRSIWTPERHFHEFGGLFPNPAVTSAALATITERIQIRAGSLISPLHDPLRIAEEWAVVDNLSRGRVAISFGSGWNMDDFVFFPERYAVRQKVMYEGIETVRSLWRGETITRRNSDDRPTVVATRPRPVQEELPVWVTSSGNVETYISAGRIGANLLTHLVGQDLEKLAEKIRRYRGARAEAGFDPGLGIVSLMLHTFIGPDLDAVRETVRRPFQQYIRSAISLEMKAAASGGAISGGHRIENHEIPTDAMQDLLDVSFERYFRTAALMGTPETCLGFVHELEAIGVDEIACLVDFGVDADSVLGGMEYLNQLRDKVCPLRESAASASMLNDFNEVLEEF
jgi:natural product biosynthesis luciferase-like monooxygenase protein